MRSRLTAPGGSRKGQRVHEPARSLLLTALLLGACGGANETVREGGVRSDASDREPDTGDETPRDGDAGEATGASQDGGQAPDRDAGTRDAASRDAAADAGGNQSGQDASSAMGNARRREVCGETTSFPNPLPSDTSKRKAEPVGSMTFGFIEGPVWLAAQGVLLFSDMNFSGGDAMGPPSRIRRLMPPATFDEFNPASNSNGLALAPDGSLLAATHDNQALSRFSMDGVARTQLTVLVDGKHFNSPNDLTVRSDGTVYFTDPDWQLGPRSSETKMTGVYRVSSPLSVTGENAAKLVEGTLQKPNGVALSPDEQTLYIGSQGNEIWKYPVQSDGALGARSKFADTGSSDGMAVDCAGNLYVASGTLEVFAPSGMKLGEITLDGDPSNAAFGGSDRKTLYITAGAKLYAIALNVPGFPY
jgi:gluconolactonase